MQTCRCPAPACVCEGNAEQGQLRNAFPLPAKAEGLVQACSEKGRHQFSGIPSCPKEKEGTPIFLWRTAKPDIKGYLRVIWRHVLILVILAPSSFAAHIHARNDEVDDLLARPQGLRLEDCRHGYPPIPVLQPHQDVHEQVLLNEGVPLGHQPAPQQGVLHNSNDRLVGLHKHKACYGAAVNADSHALKCRCGIVYNTTSMHSLV